jgi:molecular chaperone HtpG
MTQTNSQTQSDTTPASASPSNADRQTFTFQAETRELLHLMIHSLYSNKEIFLRELISNASDAADKLRFLAIQNSQLQGDDTELHVDLIPDAEAGTLTIRDNGIGMSRQEVIDNLGTIARSGTKQFLQGLSKDKRDEAQMIGQFGVGFYSAFIVADRVSVLTRRADSSEAVRWESEGAGDYTLEAAEKAGRGTDVTLHLREDDKEFLEAERLRHIVRKYSDHIGMPVRLITSAEEGGEETVDTLNRAAALWTRPKSEISDEDYQQFYTHISHDPLPPLTWAHQKVEGNLSYTSLLYLPSHAPMDLWDRERRRGVHLYVKRVFILDQAAELLPSWLRFVRGLVDSDDLPLNVSRELLQSNRTVDKIRSALVKRSLDMIEDVAKNKPEEYAKFWESFGIVLKEGFIEDFANRERLSGLCRFRSTLDTDKASASLADYVARMPEDQPSIYYLTADTLSAAKNSPLLEGIKARGWEALLLTDRIDEWVALQLTEFQGKKLASVATIDALPAPAIETPEASEQASAFRATLERLEKILAGKIKSVRLSQGRLTDSPSCLVDAAVGMTRRLQKLYRDAGEQLMSSATLPDLELNPNHPLVSRLRETHEEGAFSDLGLLLFEQAQLAEGAQLEDPAAFVKRLNGLILGGQSAAGRIILG